MTKAAKLVNDRRNVCRCTVLGRGLSICDTCRQAGWKFIHSADAHNYKTHLMRPTFKALTAEVEQQSLRSTRALSSSAFK